MTLQNIQKLKNQIRIPKVMGKVLFDSSMSLTAEHSKMHMHGTLPFPSSLHNDPNNTR